VSRIGRFGERCGRCVRHAHDGGQVAQNPGHVKKRIGGVAGIILLAANVLVCARVEAQQRPMKAVAVTRIAGVAPRAMAYAASRETAVQGTIIQYEERSETAPIGAHAKVQTAGGVIDVHLGPASYLKGKNFSLAAGDAVRFVGMQAVGKKGSVFVARSVERGGETLVLRSPRGFLMAGDGGRARVATGGAQSLRHGGAR
jgi:hypothetical protein